MSDWSLDATSDIDRWLDRPGWFVFKYHRLHTCASWQSAVQWCEERLGNRELGGNDRWLFNGFNGRIAIQDPNDAFEFRMRFC